jgi:hypothetical protein
MLLAGLTDSPEEFFRQLHIFIAAFRSDLPPSEGLGTDEHSIRNIYVALNLLFSCPRGIVLLIYDLEYDIHLLN